MILLRPLWYILASLGVALFLLHLPDIARLFIEVPLISLTLVVGAVVLGCLLRALERALKRAFHPSRVWRDIRRERSRHGR